MLIGLSTEKIRLRVCDLSIVDSCNLTCAHCGAFAPHIKRPPRPLAEVLKTIDLAAKVLKIDLLQIGGGEPLLHPNLVEILSFCRNSQLSQQMMLITNGLLMHSAPTELWELIDRLMLTVYPGLNLKLPSEKIAEKCRRHGIEFFPVIRKTFNYRFLNKKNEHPGLLQEVFQTCKLKYNCHNLRESKFFKCGTSAVLRDFLDATNIDDSQHCVSDGVSLMPRKTLRKEINAYLLSNKPLFACQYCTGSLGKEVGVAYLGRSDQEAELQNYRHGDNSVDTVMTLHQEIAGGGWFSRTQHAVRNHLARFRGW
jgi:uncharacterized Fe-S cluster-containing radical SAM superfamily protein